jgi:hypothetical protein
MFPDELDECICLLASIHQFFFAAPRRVPKIHPEHSRFGAGL